MRSSPRLNDLPFLAATAAMALALVLPWLLPEAGGPEEPAVEISDILPWAAPDPEAPPAPVQLAGQAATRESVAQP